MSWPTQAGSNRPFAPARDGAGSSGVSNPTTPAERGDGRADEVLLESYLNGDLGAFQTLVERYQRELYHFLVRFLGDRAAAEDVFQEAFLQVHQSGGQFDLSRRFRPWLFTIAANKARDLMRAQARRPTNPLQAEISPGEGEGGQFIDLMSADIPTPDEPLSREELAEAVQGTVMGLPDHLREILLLSYFHQFPYKQIADILEIPLGTVKSRLHAAVGSFAERWKVQVKRFDGDDPPVGRGGNGDGSDEDDKGGGGPGLGGIGRSEGRPAPSSISIGTSGSRPVNDPAADHGGSTGNATRTAARPAGRPASRHGLNAENRSGANGRRFGA